MPPPPPAHSPKVPREPIDAEMGPNSPATDAEMQPHYSHSAPSYLQSLAESDLPPFKKPAKESRPKLLVPFPLINEDDMVEVIAATDGDPVNGLKKALGKLLVDKEVIHNYDLTERNFLVSFLMETVDYAAQRDFSAFKLSTLFTIYLTTHLYFKWYYWSSPVAIWSYFKELMIRHTVEDSPDGQACYDPNECYDIVSHFHAIYITNLPLIHIVTFGAHRLRLNWPFKA